MSAGARAEILPGTAQAIQRAGELLRAGEIVGMPTETVYGLAGALFDETALAKVFAAKERPTFDPLIAHVAWSRPPSNYMEALLLAGVIDLGALSPAARARSEKLLRAFWPGPFTLVLPKNKRVPDLATSGLASVAVREPRHPIAQAMILAAGSPLAAPSANRFGRISPTAASHVERELGDRIRLIIDGGPCEVGVESTVVAVAADGGVALLRPGGIARSEIERVAGVSARIALPASRPESAPAGQAAPGMLDSHYAPSKPLTLLPAPLDSLLADAGLAMAQSLRLDRTARVGLLVQRGEAGAQAGEFERRFGVRPCEVRVLSASGSSLEAARNLFRSLRELDESEAETLVAEPATLDPDGLGHAIQDRLSRASHR